MFVTNLASHPLGVDGIIILKPNEENRFIEETEDLVSRVKRLQNFGLVSAKYDEGLVKDGTPTAEPKAKPKETPKAKVEAEKPPVDVVVEPIVEEEPATKPKTRGGRGAK